VSVSMIIFAMVLAPWFIRNNRLFGITNLSSRGEIVLLSRALKTDYSPEKIKAAYVYYVSVYLGSRAFPGIIENPRDFMLADDHRVFAFERELINKGYSKDQVSAALKAEAIDKIKAHPFKYILFTPLELLKMMGFMHLPFLSEPYGIAKFKTIMHGDILLVILRGLFKSAGYITVALFLIGAYLTINKWMRHFLILAPIVYINFVYGLLNGYPRFSVPLIPFYFAYAAIAVSGIAQKLNTNLYNHAEK